jgi:ornithine cyclodeaminase
MARTLGTPVVAASDARSAVADAEIVLLATRAIEPVIAASDLRRDAHVSTVGPKGRNAHELPADLVEGSWKIASDSPRQIRTQRESFFIGNAHTLDRIEHLGSLEPAGNDRGGRTCYLSAGLSGTEVLIAAHLLSRTTS